MSKKTKSVVRIAGNEYTLSADMPEEYVHKVAIHVDKRMTQIQQMHPEYSTAMIAVLAAVTVTDELFEARGDKQAFATGREPAQDAQLSMLGSIAHPNDDK